MQNGAVIFDLDGTLIDSAPAILDAYSAVLEEAGIESFVPLDGGLIGPPLAEALAKISGSSDAALLRTLAKGFKRHYDTAGVAATRVYPGIEAMLERFGTAGVEMHISTNKRWTVTHAILEHLGWSDCFVSIYALDMVEPRLPGKQQLLAKQIAEQRIDPASTVYVGDRSEDGDAAEGNGLAFCYAAWGYGGLVRDEVNPEWRWLGHAAEIDHSILRIERVRATVS